MSSTSVMQPFYTPKANTCSHCWLNPRASSHTVSFYEYPCGKKHLAHPNCFQAYVKTSIPKGPNLTPCRMCQKEFGVLTVTVNPVPKKEVIVQLPKESIEVISTTHKSIKIKLFVAFALLLVIGVFLFLTLKK